MASTMAKLVSNSGGGSSIGIEKGAGGGIN
jgi:hypothetical protein